MADQMAGENGMNQQKRTLKYEWIRMHMTRPTSLEKTGMLAQTQQTAHSEKPLVFCLFRSIDCMHAP